MKIDSDVEVELIDANQTPVDAASLNADLVAISVMTATALCAYRFAEACCAHGLLVVLGGINRPPCQMKRRSMRMWSLFALLCATVVGARFKCKNTPSIYDDSFLVKPFEDA